MGDLPRLTKPQMARLVEVGLGRDTFQQSKPATTDACVAAGTLERFRRHGSRRVRPTPLGARVLAGLPGAEFDRFRETVKEKQDG